MGGNAAGGSNIIRDILLYLARGLWRLMEAMSLANGRPVARKSVQQMSRRQLDKALPQHLYRAVQLGIIGQLMFYKFEGQHHGS